MMSTSLFNSEGFTDDILQHILGYLDESERFQAATVSKRFNKSANGLCIPYLLEIDSSTTHRVDAGFWSRLLEYVNTKNVHYRNNPASFVATGDDDAPVTLLTLLDELQIPARVLLHATRRVPTKEMQGGPCTLLPGGNIAMYFFNDEKVHILDKDLQPLLESELDHTRNDSITCDPHELFYSSGHLLLRKRGYPCAIVWKLEMDNDNNIHGIQFLYWMDLSDIFDFAVGSGGTIYFLVPIPGDDSNITIEALDIATGDDLYSKEISLGFHDPLFIESKSWLIISGNHLLILLQNEIHVLNTDEELTQVSKHRFRFQVEMHAPNMGRSKHAMDKTIFYLTGDGSNRMISIDDAGILTNHDELLPAFVQGRRVLGCKSCTATASGLVYLSPATASGLVYLLSPAGVDAQGRFIGTVDEYNVATGSKERTLATRPFEYPVYTYCLDFSILANDTSVYWVGFLRNRFFRIQSFLP